MKASNVLSQGQAGCPETEALIHATAKIYQVQSVSHHFPSPNQRITANQQKSKLPKYG